MKTATPNTLLARGLIILLMIVTLLPFLSMLSAALAPQGTYPNGLPIRNGAISFAPLKWPGWTSSCSRAR